MSDQFVAGDRVTWTHVQQRGCSINMTTREGKIEKRSELKPECFIVKWRGRRIRIHETHLRKHGERTTLTEFVMGREKVNAKVSDRPTREKS